jgi:hypothetical protein
MMPTAVPTSVIIVPTFVMSATSTMTSATYI